LGPCATQTICWECSAGISTNMHRSYPNLTPGSRDIPEYSRTRVSRSLEGVPSDEIVPLGFVPYQEAHMAGVGKRNFDSPDESRTPDKTRSDVVHLGGTTAARLTLEPGWTWAECVKPVAGTERCQHRHVGVVQSGRMRVTHEDGTVLDLGPGEAYVTSAPTTRGLALAILLGCTRDVPAGLASVPPRKKNPGNSGVLIGAPRFELGTSSPPDWRANQAAPRPATPSTVSSGFAPRWAPPSPP
jgi:hypothetical protein